jgi:hypothetical protein
VLGRGDVTLGVVLVRLLAFLEGTWMPEGMRFVEFLWSDVEFAAMAPLT